MDFWFFFCYLSLITGISANHLEEQRGNYVSPPLVAKNHRPSSDLHLNPVLQTTSCVPGSHVLIKASSAVHAHVIPESWAPYFKQMDCNGRTWCFVGCPQAPLLHLARLWFRLCRVLPTAPAPQNPGFGMLFVEGLLPVSVFNFVGAMNGAGRRSHVLIPFLLHDPAQSLGGHAVNHK